MRCASSQVRGVRDSRSIVVSRTPRWTPSAILGIVEGRQATRELDDRGQIGPDSPTQKTGNGRSLLGMMSSSRVESPSSSSVSPVQAIKQRASRDVKCRAFEMAGSPPPPIRRYLHSLHSSRRSREQVPSLTASRPRRRMRLPSRSFLLGRSAARSLQTPSHPRLGCSRQPSISSHISASLAGHYSLMSSATGPSPGS